MSRNLAASIRARLKQRADATKQDFNLIKNVALHLRAQAPLAVG